MSNIFPKIYLKFDLKYFHSIVFKVLFVTKQMNSNKYYSTISYNHCNTYSYSYVITVTVYQTCPKNTSIQGCKGKYILHLQTLLYLFYQLISQPTIHPRFLFLHTTQ